MSALEERYASDVMKYVFSPQKKYHTWRRIWLALAIAQRRLGLPITNEQLDLMRNSIDSIDLDRAVAIEKITRHDVMAHIRLWGEQVPEIAGIIHLGATSCFVTDNAEYLIYREAIKIIMDRVVELIRALADSKANHPIECLGYTHFQPAQPVTMSKRVACWIQDLERDYQNLFDLDFDLPCRGIQGTTGSLDSYLSLLGTIDRVNKLQDQFVRLIAASRAVPISGQTLSRKWDIEIGNALVGVAATLSKFGNDIRLLSHTNECYGVFGKNQVGSSAMPYKRNPMKAERICSLTRLIPGYHSTLVHTAMTQWLERSLDDSAARRVAIVDMFYAIDGALMTAIDLAKHLEISSSPRLEELRPYLLSERIISQAVKEGINRQEIHDCLMQCTRDSINTQDFLNRFKQHYPDLLKKVNQYGLSGLSDYKAQDCIKRVIGRLQSYTITHHTRKLSV